MFKYYKIKEGDSINNLCSRFCIEPRKLMLINNIFDSNSIRAGMEIIVPDNQEQYFNLYTIEKGDSIYKIAERYNINPTLLANLNGLDMTEFIYPNQEILIPKSGFSYYLTAEGDTLETVAEMFKISKEELIKENPTIYLLKDQIMVTKRK